MERHRDQDLDRIRQGLLRMGGLVERMISEAMQALLERDDARAHAVIRTDSEVDQRTGTPYYTARVLLDEGVLAQLPEGRAIPGMPVEASIIAGERTLIEYLLKPILDSFRRSFVER